MLNSIKSIAAISLFSIALGGGQCPGGGNSTPTPVPTYGCVKDASKVANIIAENDQWAKDPAIAKKLQDMAGAIGTAWEAGDIENSRKSLAASGTVKKAYSGNDNVFELDGFDGFIIKMGKVDGNKEFAQARIDAQQQALKVIQSKGENCIAVARAAFVTATLSDSSEVYAEVEEKLDILSDFSNIEKQYEDFYAKFKDPAVGSKWISGFRELFRQQAEFGCETGFMDYKFNNWALVGSLGDKASAVDLDFDSPPDFKGRPLGEKNQYALYFLLSGATPTGAKFKVAMPHEMFFPEIYSQMEKCIQAHGKSLPVTLTWGSSVTLDNDIVQKLADARTARQTGLHKFEEFLSAGNIGLDTKIDMAKALAVPGINVPEATSFLNYFNQLIDGLGSIQQQQTLAYTRWIDSIYTGGITCAEVKTNTMDKLADAGFIYDFVCTGERSYQVRF